MAVYVGHDECRVIYVAKNGQQLRVSSVWVGDQQVFPPANRQEVHLFTRDTQGYGREDHGALFAFYVPVPWWATSADVVIIGAGEKGRDGTKDWLGGSDGAGGKSGAWVVKTIALTASNTAMVTVGKGTSTAPEPTAVYLYSTDGQATATVHDGEGARTANNGSTGGSVTPFSRTEFDTTHMGQTGGTRNNPGRHPGGGGGGGQGSGLIGNPKSGQPGGDGYVWLRFRSAPALNPGDGGFILFVGAASGIAHSPLRTWAVGIGETYMTITEITVPMEVIGPSLQELFYGCYSLTSIPELDTSQVTNMRSMFNGCSALAAIPALDTSQVTDMQRMFSSCVSLTAIPDLDTSQVTNMISMFHICTSLTSIPELDTSQVTHMFGMFQGCSSLTAIPDLDTGNVVSMGSMFVGCSSLESVTLTGMGNGFAAAQTLDMKATKLNADAANALMQSLGTPAPGGTLRLPATAAGADTSIAAAKNWTVTVG